ncbi:MAG: hypothetical protein PHE78_08660, partial [Candidatus Gastranaerophilales bacterium]|nr:hypothetical protein [Candidatus Gastranaerophilales bacterium]
MVRIGAIKSKKSLHPSISLKLMRSQQKGHDNSDFAFVMQDLGGIFEAYKDLPTLSMAATVEGTRRAEDILHSLGFVRVLQWSPDIQPQKGLKIDPMPNYVFEVFQYPKSHKYATKEEKEELLVDTSILLRKELEKDNQGYVYSFWPDTLTLKEIGSPKDIGTYFGLWDDSNDLCAKIITAQCRQNTNYDIVRYAAHPFFLEGYTILANGENTFYEKNRLFQKGLYKGYIGFESDSQCFLYTLHYIHKILKWPIEYYKHTITPLPFEEIEQRADRDVLLRIKASLGNLEINGPNTILGVSPSGDLLCVCDSKKLRPVVIGQDDDTIIMTSEVNGINDLLPNRDVSKDIYPNEREMILIGDDLKVKRWQQ